MRSFCLFLGHGNRLTMAGWVSLVLSVSTPLALAIAGGIWMGIPRNFFAFPIYMFLVAGSSLIIWSLGSVLGRRAGVPRRQDRDLSRADWDPRTPRHQRGSVARPARETEGRPTARPIRRREPKALARCRRTPASASPRKPGRLPCAIKRSEAGSRLALGAPSSSQSSRPPVHFSGQSGSFRHPFRLACAPKQQFAPPMPRPIRPASASPTRSAWSSRDCDAYPAHWPRDDHRARMAFGQIADHA